MKKRLLALLLAGAMSVGLAACGNSGDEGSANTPAGGETTPVTALVSPPPRVKPSRWAWSASATRTTRVIPITL